MLKLYFCINIHCATITVSRNPNGWSVCGRICILFPSIMYVAYCTFKLVYITLKLSYFTCTVILSTMFIRHLTCVINLLVSNNTYDLFMMHPHVHVYSCQCAHIS